MEKFAFKLEGPFFKEGVPIHIAIKAWDNFQSIIDKTYLVATDSHRFRSIDREKYYLRATSFERSSFITKFEILLAGAQLALPIMGVLGPQGLWEYTKESFNFLKLICSNKEDDQKIRIDVKNSQNTNVYIGDKHYNFNGPVYQIAEKALPKYQKLAHMLESGKLDVISAGRTEEPEVVLKSEDRELFDFPTRTEEEAKEIKCEIFTFNKFNNVGKLRVPDGQLVPKGDYNFSIFGDQDSINYIYSMLKPLVTVKCYIEMAISPLGPELISHLHISDILS